MGHVDALHLLIEVGHADINATDKVSHITVSYELFSFKYDILIWYSKLIPTCLIPRLPIISNILITKNVPRTGFKNYLQLEKY